MTIDYKDLVLEELNYNSYLKLPELLDLQHLRSQPHHPDEMFFIIIHQSAELWFKEVLHETTRLVESFRENTVSRALKAIKRIGAIMELQVQQIRLLGTLTPIEFSGFRGLLKPASGFQSAQFREMEFTYGLRNPFFLQFFEKLPDIRARLARIQTEPSVYDEALMCLSRAGYTVPEEILKRDYSKAHEVNERLTRTVRQIYEDPRENFHWVLLFEAMLDLDEKLMLWRKTHAVMVERTIGQKAGTGGSTGWQFLRTREDLKCFPELWDVRNMIGSDV
ncbi:Tryptophan 2,3-dioxygenase [Sulfidibacter corallicola]|uniref:Tryptophan 2,3-dioxygenase n=1 Tax=Sulfidibacter corallicola TaxID=2818388 RepID=A0A8A4TMJ4_SULCO|nr:tryptophan 2,3-dioxygenase family protein [Sulfidibacter corallicola]QTD47815.1 hypothetical protein J3U87_19680 [Sulfidibacter corallicola]